MTLQLEGFGSVGILKVLRIATKYGPLNISVRAKSIGGKESGRLLHGSSRSITNPME